MEKLKRLIAYLHMMHQKKFYGHLTIHFEAGTPVIIKEQIESIKL